MRRNRICSTPRHCEPIDFYRKATEIMQRAKPDEYALVSLDFDNFNFINDLFGYDIGDKTLGRMEERFAAEMDTGEFFARIHADHFVFWVRTGYSTPLMDRFYRLVDVREALADILPYHYNLVCSGGVVYVREEDESLNSIMDKANFARKQSKGSHLSTFMHFDKKMQEDLKWKKLITFSMESALQNGEFEMYLQPKIMICTNQIVGAEALARWDSPRYGMIYPDKFIHVMEQNGFIKQLDFFILEQACIFINESAAMGIAILPVSVNFSKLHMRTPNFVETVFGIVRKYGISTRLIEIEITESIFSDDFQAMVNIASGLKYLGFKVLLDDFGSAYSSLNYLKDLPLDGIKIDKGFLDATKNTNNGRVIIAKVVELIKSLRMVSVMEGVENSEQIDFLKMLSCDIGQGYFYAKPMPRDDYVEFIKNGTPVVGDYLTVAMEGYEKQDKSYLRVIPQEFQMDSWELYTLGQNIDMGLMKGYLDGEATVQYVNDKALEYLGYTRREFREVFGNSIVAFTHPDDGHIVQANAEQLISTGEPLTFQTRAVRKDGKIIVLRGRSSCVMDSHGRPVGLYAFQDVTEEVERDMSIHRAFREKVAELEATISREWESREAARLSGVLIE